MDGEEISSLHALLTLLLRAERKKLTWVVCWERLPSLKAEGHAGITWSWLECLDTQRQTKESGKAD